MTKPNSITEASCADDYDPNSMPVAKARAFIHSFLTPVKGIARVPLRTALGRVLAEDIISPVDVPAHINSAMDGWALRADDLAANPTAALTEIGSSFAGVPFGKSVGKGECVRIFTGGVVPDGCDAVVMQERAQANGTQITFSPGVKKSQNVRYAGEDLQAGAVALAKGRIVRPAELGLMASLGIGEVGVNRPLRVVFFSTGDELTMPGEPLKPGAIYNSNRFMLVNMLRELGCEVIDFGIVPDSLEATRRTLREAALASDLIVTSGGVSVGEEDHVKPAVEAEGGITMWQIAIKPGKPLAYGFINTPSAGKTHFLGLPGNPVSSFVTFLLFVQP